MQLKPCLLDAWIDQYEHDIEFNLAASTGPTWTVNDILALADDETRHRFLNHNLVHSRPAGAGSLREAIADMYQPPCGDGFPGRKSAKVMFRCQKAAQKNVKFGSAC